MTERPRTDTDGAWLLPFLYSADGGLAHTALVHTAVVDGRRVIDRLVITAPDITAATLRKLPMGPLTAYAERGKQLPPRLGAKLDAALKAVDSHPHLVIDTAILQAAWDNAARPRLTRPDGTDPEGFSRRVAAAYNEAVLRTSTPAKVLAEEAGVPVTTVHRWVRDARRLGLLPPARQGRAG